MDVDAKGTMRGTESKPAMSVEERLSVLATKLDADVIRDWVNDRYEHCLLIAIDKHGEDRASWLEDAVYFKRVLDLLPPK